MTPIDQIINGTKVIARFGHWPSFHDAEVLRFALDRQGSSGPFAEMLIHTWLMTSEVDPQGFYVLQKHTLVRLLFEELLECEFTGFNDGNILLSLEVEPETVEGRAALRVNFPTSYGLDGSLVCGRVVVADVTPCDPRGKMSSKG
jgi:Immunity protein 50